MVIEVSEDVVCGSNIVSVVVVPAVVGEFVDNNVVVKDFTLIGSIGYVGVSSVDGVFVSLLITGEAVFVVRGILFVIVSEDLVICDNNVDALIVCAAVNVLVDVGGTFTSVVSVIVSTTFDAVLVCSAVLSVNDKGMDCGVAVGNTVVAVLVPAIDTFSVDVGAVASVSVVPWDLVVDSSNVFGNTVDTKAVVRDLEFVVIESSILVVGGIDFVMAVSAVIGDFVTVDAVEADAISVVAPNVFGRL